MSHPIPGHEYRENVVDIDPDSDETEASSFKNDSGNEYRDYKDQEVRGIK